jgi:hypothetical protein
MSNKTRIIAGAHDWLHSEFSGGPSAKKIAKITDVEQRCVAHTTEVTK